MSVCAGLIQQEILKMSSPPSHSGSKKCNYCGYINEFSMGHVKLVKFGEGRMAMVRCLRCGENIRLTDKEFKSVT